MWVDWSAKALDHSGVLRVELDVDGREEGGRRWKKEKMLKKVGDERR